MKLLPFDDTIKYNFKLQTIELLLLHTIAEEFIDTITPLINSNTKFKFSIGTILNNYTARNLNREDLKKIHDLQNKNIIIIDQLLEPIGDCDYEITPL